MLDGDMNERQAIRMAHDMHSGDTERRILDSARRLFAEKGYEKTSIQDILNDLGLSKGGLYHHFKSKEAILDRLNADEWAVTARLLDKLIERNELSPGESSTREILDPQGKPRWRQARISFLKNRPYHQHVTEYLTLLGDEQVPEILRVRMAEALAWFNLSVRRHEIADAGRKLLARGNCSPELAKEVQRMINRVESKK